MTVHKWATNDERILPANAGGQIIKTFGDPEETPEGQGRALGLVWRLGDELGFEVPMFQNQGLTKRRALSLNNSRFDPHGYLLPFKMTGRLLYKETCVGATDWDTQLEPKTLEAWGAWYKDMTEAKEVSLPRWVHMEEARAIHCFGDASGQAYGACVYLVTQQGSFLMGAKGHLVRSQAQTIPRLELEAAIECMNLGLKLQTCLELATDQVHFWSDSVNALSWIKAPSRQLEPYIARRVQRIRENTQPDRWHHVPTQENPADLVSRGCTMAKLRTLEIWWQGPKFLLTEAWPEEKVAAQPQVTLPEEAELEQLLRGFAGYLVDNPLENAGTFLQGSRLVKILLTRLKGQSPGPTLVFKAWSRYEQGRWFPRELEKSPKIDRVHVGRCQAAVGRARSSAHGRPGAGRSPNPNPWQVPPSPVMDRTCTRKCASTRRRARHSGLRSPKELLGMGRFRIIPPSH